MNKIAKFEKISVEQLNKDTGLEEDILNTLNLPARATKDAAGYDFYSPIAFELKPGESIKVPTCVRCKIESGWVLQIFPRSSIGFKYQVQLANTVGIIDGDYYNADNEGHIWIKLTNRGEKPLLINKNERFAQGIFIPYGITVDDKVDNERTGGLGSTGI